MKKDKKATRKKCAKGEFCDQCGRRALPDPAREEWDGKLILMGDRELCPTCFLGEDLLSENQRTEMREFHYSHIQRSGADFGRTPGDERYRHVARSEVFTREEKEKLNKFAQDHGLMRGPKEQKDMMFTTVPLTTMRG
jgi:hypothetical protein